MAKHEKYNPTPVVKEMTTSQIGHSQLSAKALDSFAQTRPSQVDRDFLAGNEYRLLINGLNKLEPALTSFMEHKIERDLEAGTAEGLELFEKADIPEEEKLRMNFKEITEKHPELIGNSPYVWKGYEKARLNNLALSFDSGLQKMYAESGLNNEEDPVKVQQAIDNFSKQFRKDNRLDGYSNPIDLAKNFTVFTAASKKNLMGQHDQDQKKQIAEKLVNATQENIMKSVEAFFGSNMNSARTIDSTLPEVHKLMSVKLNEMAMNGIPNSKVPEIYSAAVFTLYEKYGQNPRILALLDNEVMGVRPSSLDGVQKKVRMLEEQREAKAMREAQEARSRIMFNQHQEELKARGDGVRWILDNPNRSPTPEEVKQVVGDNPLNQFEFIKAAGQMQNARATVNKNSPDYIYNAAMLRAEIAQGKEYTPSQIAAFAAAYNDPSLMQYYIEAQNKTDTETAGFFQSIGEMVKDINKAVGPDYNPELYAALSSKDWNGVDPRDYRAAIDTESLINRANAWIKEFKAKNSRDPYKYELKEQLSVFKEEYLKERRITPSSYSVPKSQVALMDNTASQWATRKGINTNGKNFQQIYTTLVDNGREDLAVELVNTIRQALPK